MLIVCLLIEMMLYGFSRGALLRAWLFVLIGVCVGLSSAQARAGTTPKSKAKAWVGPRHAVFGQELVWTIVDVHSRDLRRVRFAPEFNPTSVAITPDGQWLVFTSYDPSVQNTLLFKWDGLPTSKPMRIGDERGYHAEVAVSHDGKKAYFAHHPLAGGPPGQHEMKASAQLYEVGLDGSNLRALTSGQGCHIGPTSPHAGRLFFVHTPCDGRRFLSVVELSSGKVVDHPVSEWRVGEVSLSPDGRRLLLTSTGSDRTRIIEMDVSSRKASVLLEVEHDSSTLKPQYGIDSTQILFQNQGAIWLVQGGRTTKLASLQE
ncbi:hypothetical protein F0U60_31720 [Archangium minus]|uniref:Uncharacterized protein n=1 Tax=Archangium minus TaxID=83450 RepID=A0ABY9WYH4_9BACT|nr:hypothetical protein F0U60_31720 [Archangium minus]